MNENKNKVIQNLQDAAKAVPGQVYRDTNLPQETRKISNKQPNLTSKRTREK